MLTNKEEVLVSFVLEVLAAPLHVVRDVQEGQGRVLILQVLSVADSILINPWISHSLISVGLS